MSALKVYTFVTNKPDLIELQLNSFKRHLKEEFDFIVFNNAAMWDSNKFKDIQRECKRLNLSVIDIQYDIELASRCESLGGGPVLLGDSKYQSTNTACGYSVCWAWENIISRMGGNALLMHHDMFLIKDVKLTDYLDEHELVFVPQNRPNVDLHLWEGFTLANLNKLPEPGSVNWWCGTVNGMSVDVGGQSYHYFKAHPEVRWMGLRPVHTEDDPNVDFHPSRYEYIYCGDERIVLHYRAASNWMNLSEEYHEKKTAWLKGQL